MWQVRVFAENPVAFSGRLKTQEILLALCGWLLFLATQVAFLHLAPGFHFDEAWAANFAVRIANDPGFWPLHAQSPYTMPWAHYFAALFMKLGGVSLLVFRLSQVSLALMGIVLFSVALARAKQKQLLVYFPWLLVCFPGLVLNQRFCIELTGFHVFCGGLIFFGLSLVNSKKWDLIGRVLMMAAILMGVTSHVLFLALPLALIFYRLLTVDRAENAFSKYDRIWIACACFALVPFTLRILLGVPEKGKAIALLIGLLGLGVWLLASFPFWNLFYKQKKYWRWPFGIVSGIFFFNAAFFLEGHWVMMRQVGELNAPFYFALVALLFTSGIYFAFSKFSAREPQWRKLLLFSLCFVFFLGCLMLKPTPRYFHLAFFPLVLLATMFLVKLKPWFRYGLLAFSVLHMGSSILSNFFFPVVYGNQVDKEVRALAFKDDSRDFLSKQYLVRFFGGLNCDFRRVSTPNPRILEALNFLKHSDWPLAGGEPCPAQLIRVERARQVLNSKEPPVHSNSTRLLRYGFYVDLY